MNNALRYSMSAVFTSLATTYFIGVGIVRLAKHRPLPLFPMKLSRPTLAQILQGTLVSEMVFFKPLVAVPDPNEAMWRSVKSKQPEIKSQVANQLATLLGVEEGREGATGKWRVLPRSWRRVGTLDAGTKNALEAAQLNWQDGGGA